VFSLIPQAASSPGKESTSYTEYVAVWDTMALLGYYEKKKISLIPIKKIKNNKRKIIKSPLTYIQYY